ncbi:MAG: hypothetical protein ACRD50_06075 [Candidatus Acidiferrales bacterium]
MPDYMYMLESRLSPEQRAALERVQELAASQEANVYLTGGAVRDLISGMPIRDLDFIVEGNPVRIVRELEKGGARIVSEDERLRHFEIVFAGDCDGSISAARDEIYERPGTKPELRFAGIMEDLRRRDFSMNAVAISLNLASRGLLLDPTNGLADLERREVRALSIHAFTNQPARLMRILRYCVRMDFKMESRTQEWFDLAMTRELDQTIPPEEAGRELRQLGREDNPSGILKAWEAKGFLTIIHPSLARRKPAYEKLTRLNRVKEGILELGLRPRLANPTIFYTLSRLKPRERMGALHKLGFRAAEIEALASLEPQAQNLLRLLKGRKTSAARDAYFLLAKTPLEVLAFLQTEYPNPRALAKIRNYMTKWRPLRLSLPAAELDSLGIPRGTKFDKILGDLFELQLRGRGKNPIERTKLLKQLAGIKEEPKKKPKEEKKKAKAAIQKKAAAKQEAARTQEAEKASSEKTTARSGAIAPAGLAAQSHKSEPTKPARRRQRAGRKIRPRVVKPRKSARKHKR